MVEEIRTVWGVEGYGRKKERKERAITKNAVSCEKRMQLKIPYGAHEGTSMMPKERVGALPRSILLQLISEKEYHFFEIEM